MVGLSAVALAITALPPHALSGTAAHSAVAWVALNDVDALAGGSNAPKVTEYGYDAASGGLVDVGSGDPVGVTVTGSFDVWEPREEGGPVAAGTDAAGVFGGMVDLRGISQLSTPEAFNTLTFEGLDPAESYTITLTANRDRHHFDNARFTKVSLVGADTYVNESSDGVVAYSESVVSLNTGYNTERGYVVRWTGVTAADGTFSVVSRWDTGRGSGRHNVAGYAMSAFQLEGTGDAPSSPPGAPSGLSAAVVAADEIEAAWTAGTGVVTGFELERSVDGETGPFEQVATTGPQVTSYTDGGLAELTEYCYRVRAFNDEGPSPYSNIVCATTPSGTASYLLDIEIDGNGVVQRDPDLPLYEAGTEVTLTAVADGNWVFDGWTGDLTGTQNPATITVTGNTNITATLKRLNAVSFIWSGALTSSGITVNAQLQQPSESVRLAVSEDPSFGTRTYSSYYVADVPTNRVVSIPVSGLDANTRYHYAIDADGHLHEDMAGEFRTANDGPFSFTFGFSNHTMTGSNHGIFDEIRRRQLLFFLNLGDWHDEDIAVNDVNLFRQAYEANLTAPRQQLLHRSTPFTYMWDDHDFGPNDSDSTAPGREAARLTYQEYMPHYPLVAGNGDVPNYQSFSIGRVYFIMTDLRSERTPNDAPDDPSKSMMGAAQKNWFKQQLLYANGTYPVIVWVNSVPWIASQSIGADHWGGFSTERREIADFIEQNDIRGLQVLSGDAHALAIDDGSNNTFSTTGQPSFPVFHAGATDSTARSKGGPYSHGDIGGKNQFGLVTITDTGGNTIEIDWVGVGLVVGEYRNRISWSTTIQIE